MKRLINGTRDEFGFLPALYDNHPVVDVEFHILLKDNNLFNINDLMRIEKVINSLMYIPEGSKHQKGILLRQPMSTGRHTWEIEQHDNYWAVAYSGLFASHLRKFAEKFLWHGLTHFWHYDQRTVKKYNGWNVFYNKEAFIDWFKGFRQPYQIFPFMCMSFPVLNDFLIITCIKGLFLMQSSFKWLLFIPLLPFIHLIASVIYEAPLSNGSSGNMLLWIMSKAGIRGGCFNWFASILYRSIMRIKYGKKWQELCFSKYWGTSENATANDFGALYQLSKMD